MSRELTVQLSDPAFAALDQQAQAARSTPAELAARTLESHFRPGSQGDDEARKAAARQRFERHFGEIDLGRPTGADNESIDADLGKEYADTHETP